MFVKFEAQVLSQTTAEDWADELTKANDMLTAYILDDAQFTSNPDTSATMFYLRELRNFFKSIKALDEAS